MPEQTGLSAQMSFESLLFIDPTSRSLLGPGVGPMVQIPAAWAQPKLPPFFRDATNWMVYGDFVPPNLDSAGALIAAVLPTWTKRLRDATVKSYHENEYADDMINFFSALQLTGNPLYDATTDTGRARAISQARETAGFFSIGRILDGALMPGQPRYEPKVWTAIADHPDGGEWMKVFALRHEWQASRELFGDNQAAMLYFTDRFGMNPLRMSQETKARFARPVDKTQYDYLVTHPALLEGEHFHQSLMAWLGVEDQDNFFINAWQEWLANGDQVRLSVEEGADLVVMRLGFARYEEVQEEYDAVLVTIDDLYEKGTKKRSMAVNELDRWKHRQMADIEAEFPVWNVKGQFATIEAGSTAESMLDELLRAGNPQSSAHELARETNPQLADWTVDVTTWWRELDEYSVEKSDTNSAGWWRTGTSIEASVQRDAFIRKVRQATFNLTDENAKWGAEWYVSRVIEPLLSAEEYDPNQSFVLSAEPPPVPAEAPPIQPGPAAPTTTITPQSVEELEELNG
jgi:hypothetical protein